MSFFNNINEVGNKNALQHVMSILDEECPAIGLTLSTSHTVLPRKVSKTTVLCPGHDLSDVDLLGFGVRRLYGEGSMVLGSPIGSWEYVSEEVNKKIDKEHNLTSSFS